MTYKYDDLLKALDKSKTGICVNIKGKWEPARPKGLRGYAGFKQRVKSAWSVLTGKADAFTWPGGQ
jgi:hypothetical protein